MRTAPKTRVWRDRVAIRRVFLGTGIVILEYMHGKTCSVDNDLICMPKAAYFCFYSPFNPNCSFKLTSTDRYFFHIFTVQVDPSLIQVYRDSAAYCTPKVEWQHA